MNGINFSSEWLHSTLCGKSTGPQGGGRHFVKKWSKSQHGYQSNRDHNAFLTFVLCVGAWYYIPALVATYLLCVSTLLVHKHYLINQAIPTNSAQIKDCPLLLTQVWSFYLYKILPATRLECIHPFHVFSRAEHLLSSPGDSCCNGTHGNSRETAGERDQHQLPEQGRMCMRGGSWS